MKLIFSYGIERKGEVKTIKNILMESTNVELHIDEKDNEIFLYIIFYKKEEMFTVFNLIKRFNAVPDKIVPASFINRFFPSEEEREARKFIGNGN